MQSGDPVLVTGGSGFLGQALCAVLEGRAVPFVSVTRAPTEASVGCDLECFEDLPRLLGASRPAVVIHTAAWAALDRCRREPQRALHVNGELPEQLARLCRERSIRLIHVSTDMVFDGRGAPYAEDAVPTPLSVYGRSKLRGEQAVLDSHPEALVVRLPLLFGNSSTGRGASDMLVRAHAEGRTVGLFVDETRSPLDVNFAAECLVDLAGTARCGLVHLGARNGCSRHELGTRLAARMGLPARMIERVTQDGVPASEPRPKDLTFDVRRALSWGVPLPTVQEAVARWQPE